MISSRSTVTCRCAGEPAVGQPAAEPGRRVVRRRYLGLLPATAAASILVPCRTSADYMITTLLDATPETREGGRRSLAADRGQQVRARAQLSHAGHRAIADVTAADVRRRAAVHQRTVGQQRHARRRPARRPARCRRRAHAAAAAAAGAATGRRRPPRPAPGRPAAPRPPHSQCPANRGTRAASTPPRSTRLLGRVPVAPGRCRGPASADAASNAPASADAPAGLALSPGSAGRWTSARRRPRCRRTRPGRPGSAKCVSADLQQRRSLR